MDLPKDDLKWFGEGFDGFPKKLPEDVVEYIVFIIDTQLSDIQTRERLQAFQRALNILEKKFLKEYIWQREAIKLELIREEGRWILKGRTNYGDSVADEWLIVYLLRELSKEFKDAWIRVYDTDGEFLLIEAANALPNWLNPEVAENRVWINYHRLLVIPLSKTESPQPLSEQGALTIIQETPARPQHYPNIEKEAFHRLNNYPKAISENQHHVTLPLPREVAHILHLNPSYISSIVEAFYLRDPISIRLLQPGKSQTPLTFFPEDFVLVSVRFTRVLYAQLLGQHWDPPAPWDAALETLKKAGHAPEKAEISIKLTAGAQMLLHHKMYADKKAVREISLLVDDLESGDDTLPTDAEIANWPKREDDEAWLNIDFSEFEKELAGKGGGTQGFGDKAAQENLKKMVERFNAFINDDDADMDGAGGLDPMDVDDDSDAENRKWEDPEDSDSENTDKNNDEKREAQDQEASGNNDDDSDDNDDSDDDEYADAEFAEYEQALEKFMMLSAAEKALLTDDARLLAVETEAQKEEDEEIQRLSDLMEAELFRRGALKLNPDTEPMEHGGGMLKGESSGSAKDKKGKGKAKIEEIGDEDEDKNEDEDGDDGDGELLDEDYNLAENMLKAFKGQAGMAGPAGNLMGLMGVQFPPDADDAVQAGKGKGKAPQR